MESGYQFGIIIVTVLVVSQIAVTYRFLSMPASWRKVAMHFVLSILVAASICGFSFFMLVMGLNVSDSSHGFLSVGLPILVAILAVLVATAITVAKTALTHHSSGTPNGAP